MKNEFSKYLAGLARKRWAAIPKRERSKLVPRNGGRPPTYPPCAHYLSARHRWDEAGKCKCGYKRGSK